MNWVSFNNKTLLTKVNVIQGGQGVLSAQRADSRDGDEMMELAGGGGVFRELQDFTAGYRTHKPKVCL